MIKNIRSPGEKDQTCSAWKTTSSSLKNAEQVAA